MGFIAKLESSMDWSLHRSRIAISLSDEYPRDYSIEDAIADYTRINNATTHAQTLVYENYLRYVRELSVSVDNSCLGFIRDCGNYFLIPIYSYNVPRHIKIIMCPNPNVY